MPEPSPSVEAKSEVVVALVSSVLPPRVVDASMLAKVELNCPAMVEEPVTESEARVEAPAASVPKEAAVEKSPVDDATVEKNVVEVACWRLVLPRTVSVPLALREPPTLSREASVVEAATAKVPVEVAPVVVRPALNFCRLVKLLKSARSVEEAAFIEEDAKL